MKRRNPLTHNPDTAENFTVIRMHDRTLGDDGWAVLISCGPWGQVENVSILTLDCDVIREAHPEDEIDFDTPNVGEVPTHIHGWFTRNWVEAENEVIA